MVTLDSEDDITDFSIILGFTQEPSMPSKNKGTMAPEGDDVQTPSRRLPSITTNNMVTKVENLGSPSRPVTRSVTFLSESKVRFDRHSNVGGTHNTGVDVLKKPILEKTGRRVMETIVIGSSSKKKKVAKSQKAQASCIPKE
ncbi:Hypothetical predicted protein [Olea europaea subsp. europaea]|uniref:Uncharacterized protein n=1 Tax=Olea europaea subsp. europaea TaxID=158383 RepID=A0A8S0SUQ1_OLEEU|nr:Hypothetical predicted protein [Olea europaea subsp. europaea]